MSAIIILYPQLYIPILSRDCLRVCSPEMLAEAAVTAANLSALLSKSSLVFISPAYKNYFGHCLYYFSSLSRLTDCRFLHPSLLLSSSTLLNISIISYTIYTDQNLAEVSSIILVIYVIGCIVVLQDINNSCDDSG